LEFQSMLMPSAFSEWPLLTDDYPVVLFLFLNYSTDINLAKENKINCQRDLTKIKNSAILESLKIKTPTLFSQLSIFTQNKIAS
jgi:hypothetical protein